MTTLDDLTTLAAISEQASGPGRSLGWLARLLKRADAMDYLVRQAVIPRLIRRGLERLRAESAL
jgi:hypothetical protein